MSSGGYFRDIGVMTLSDLTDSFVSVVLGLVIYMPELIGLRDVDDVDRGVGLRNLLRGLGRNGTLLPGQRRCKCHSLFVQLLVRFRRRP